MSSLNNSFVAIVVALWYVFGMRAAGLLLWIFPLHAMMVIYKYSVKKNWDEISVQFQY